MNVQRESFDVSLHYSIRLPISTHRSPEIWEFCWINLPDLPVQHLADGVKGVLALAGRERAVEHGVWHRNFDSDRLELPTHGLLRSHSEVKFAVAAIRSEVEIVPDVDRDGDNILRANQIRHQPEVAVGRNEREDPLRLGKKKS